VVIKLNSGTGRRFRDRRPYGISRSSGGLKSFNAEGTEARQRRRKPGTRWVICRAWVKAWTRRRFTARPGESLWRVFGFFDGLLGAAFIGAEAYRIPILGPGLAPGHGAAASRAQFAWQELFVAFEAVFHCLDAPDQVNKSSCGGGGGAVLQEGLTAFGCVPLRRAPEGGRPLLREPCRACTPWASSRARLDWRKPYIRSLAALVAALSSTMGAG